MTGALVAVAVVLIVVAVVADARAHQDLSRRAMGPDSSPLPSASSPSRDGAQGRWTAAEVLAAIGVSIAAGVSALMFIVLFCVLAAIT